MPRAFGAHELSDGTLKYLCLLGVLMGYRLPSLIALNEPEASLHPSLLGPLARLVARSAQHTRIWIVTHCDFLAEALQKEISAHAGRFSADPSSVIEAGFKAASLPVPERTGGRIIDPTAIISAALKAA